MSIQCTVRSTPAEIDLGEKAKCHCYVQHGEEKWENSARRFTVDHYISLRPPPIHKHSFKCIRSIYIYIHIYI